MESIFIEVQGDENLAERVEHLLRVARSMQLKTYVVCEVERVAGKAPRRCAGRPRCDVPFRTILDAIRRHGGNKTRAAKELGIGKATMYNLLERAAQSPEARRQNACPRLVLKGCTKCGGTLQEVDPSEWGADLKCLSCGQLFRKNGTSQNG